MTAWRAAFWLTVLAAGAMVWLSPRPPLADLAQHAAQIALLRDLLLGTSPWRSLVEVNLFTPYWMGSGFALVLGFVLPVSAAVKTVLALSYYAFVLACVWLRRRMNADPRLDWLLVTPFFGLAWLYGFYPFLTALPVGVAFIALAHRHADRPSRRDAVLLLALGVTLFFSHGLVFLFANAVAVTFLLLRRQPMTSAAPFAALGLLCVLYLLLRLSEPQPAPVVAAGASWLGLGALNYLFFFPMGSPAMDPLQAAVVPLLLLAPLLLRYRVAWANKLAFAPIMLLLLWTVLVPETVAETYFVGSRFAALLLPFYVLMFVPSSAASGWRLAPVAVLTWAALGVQADRLMAFATESRSFEEVLAAAEPGQRAQQIVLDMASPAARTPMAYQNFPLWYQAEKTGFVDFNFAAYPAQVVRFRDAGTQTSLPMSAYRYIFVHGDSPSRPTDGDCELVPRKSSGAWRLFEVTGC